MNCFITRTGSFLPGEPIDNDSMQEFIGTLEGESEIKQQVLAMNGIKQRYYALDREQNPTHDVYQLAALAIENCLGGNDPSYSISYLSAGSTYAPLSGPGLSSILHDRLAQKNIAPYPLEVNSNSGICTSASTALLNGYRAIRTGDHQSAICVGTEAATQATRANKIKPDYDVEVMKRSLRESNWFKAVFLRFMLSDGAGAFLLQHEPVPNSLSLKINWSFAQSFANEAPLCMTMENGSELLSQNVKILSRYLFKCAKKFVSAALTKHDETLDSYKVILPHLSSYFFQRKMEKIMRGFTSADEPVSYWTNLATVGNTGAASIYIMLDEYLKTANLKNGDRIMLFIPESGQFNFMLFSLTAVC